jgi:hypothetical protein
MESSLMQHCHQTRHSTGSLKHRAGSTYPKAAQVVLRSRLQPPRVGGAALAAPSRCSVRSEVSSCFPAETARVGVNYEPTRALINP